MILFSIEVDMHSLPHAPNFRAFGAIGVQGIFVAGGTVNPSAQNPVVPNLHGSVRVVATKRPGGAEHGEFQEYGENDLP